VAMSEVKAWVVETDEGVLVGPFSLEQAAKYVRDDENPALCGKIRPLLSTTFTYSKVNDVRMVDVKLTRDEDEDEPSECLCGGCMGDSEDSEDEEQAR